MYELKSSRKSTRNKKIVAQIKQQLIKRQEFFCVYFRVILCYHSHNRKGKLEKIVNFNISNIKPLTDFEKSDIIILEYNKRKVRKCELV